MTKCTRCGEYSFARFGGIHDECQCKKFTIIDEDGDEHELFSTSDHEAALKYAENSNVENEYYLMDQTIEIEVDGKKFKISAEPDVHYSASRVEQQSKQG